MVAVYRVLLSSGWWFGTWILFFHILGTIIPTDFRSIIFQRGGSTTNQVLCHWVYHQPTGYKLLPDRIWWAISPLAWTSSPRCQLPKPPSLAPPSRRMWDDVGQRGETMGMSRSKNPAKICFAIRFQNVFNAVLYGFWWDYQWFIDPAGAEALLVAGRVLATDNTHRIQIDIWRFGCRAILSLDAQRNAVNMQQFHSSNGGFSGRM